jgi:peptidylprolyl isomerase
MAKNKTAHDGDTVKIHYTGTLEDGEIFDSSDGRDPLSFTVGEGMVIQGFEDGVKGMAVGEEKDLVIPPELGYGDPRPELIRDVQRKDFGDLEPAEGMIVGMQIPGIPQVFPARITKVVGEDVTLDLNPPLAGKTLRFHVTLVEIVAAPEANPSPEAAPKKRVSKKKKTPAAEEETP